MMPEFERLERYRLDSDLSYAGLAREMADALLAVSPTTLHHVLSHPAARCAKRTHYKIRRFVKRIERKRKRPLPRLSPALLAQP